MSSKTICVTLKKPSYQILRRNAKQRGITLQSFLRAVIIPSWLRTHNGYKPRKQGKKQSTRRIKAVER